MAHPVRWRLLDVLRADGPSTVSMLAERVGERVPNVSHHLKVLGTAGLIGDAPELAHNRRERWWRLLAPSVRWSMEDFADDPGSAAIAQAAASLNLDRHTGLARAWEVASEDERAWWQGSSFATDKWLQLTPDELAELSDRLIALLDEYAGRSVRDDGRERRQALVFAYGVPAQP